MSLSIFSEPHMKKKENMKNMCKAQFGEYAAMWSMSPVNSKLMKKNHCHVIVNDKEHGALVEVSRWSGNSRSLGESRSLLFRTEGGGEGCHIASTFNLAVLHEKQCNIWRAKARSSKILKLWGDKESPRESKSFGDCILCCRHGGRGAHMAGDNFDFWSRRAGRTSMARRAEAHRAADKEVSFPTHF